MKSDFFGVESELSLTSGKKVRYASLRKLDEQSKGAVSKLPYSLRIVLESVLRNLDDFVFTKEHVQEMLRWNPRASERPETPYMPARVVLQDFTGVPAVVDLASMRDCVKRLGGDPKRINPGIPCDLVIDHSVQVDFYGRTDALRLNEEKEFERNRERYEFLKWGQGAFRNFRVVPPATGIVHQVNLEHLSTVVHFDEATGLVYPDSCVGTDSHTPMVNGLGILAWGVGGIEAEAVMLAQPIYMLIPDVVGFRLTGKLPEGITATDVVLRITEMCRQKGVVGKFVEFFGPGVDQLSIADRATIGNMAPEQGSTVSIFPPDEQVLRYLRLTGRPADRIDLVERYLKEQGLFRQSSDVYDFSDLIELDLASIEPAVAGPKRPQDRLPLSQVGKNFKENLSAPAPKGFAVPAADTEKIAKVSYADGSSEEIRHGAVVIAAITSCTNTSNPSVMVASGLLAKKAVERGLRVNRTVKTSLAPGSTVVTEYLQKAGLMSALETLGFHVVGYGCTTCIGNSGALPDEVAKAVSENDIVASAVLSGNRNFEGRVNPLTRTNYLASPPLVVAYAIAGTTAIDLHTDPIGKDTHGKPVFLKDIWPSNAEIEAAVLSSVTPELFASRYADVWKGSKRWQEIASSTGELYQWDEASTYIRKAPFFDEVGGEARHIESIQSARVLGFFGDSITTDHISPAGSIAGSSPAGKYLLSLGVEKSDWNSYGARRGNHEVMMRGTFANIRIKNKLVPGKEGNLTRHIPSGEELSFYDASQRYISEGSPLIILAGKEYGSGSSRDWAAKGPQLQGVRAVVAQSYERIHRSNLIGMGILPLEFLANESAESLGLTGEETYSIPLPEGMKPQQSIEVIARSADGKEKRFATKSRIDTPVEVDYYRNGGILHTVLLQG